MSLPIDIKFRLEAAARVLERAARRTNDPNLRDQLLKVASSLRAAAETGTITGTLMGAEDTGAKTIEDVVREIRELIWRGSSRQQPEKPLKDVEIGLLKPLEPLEAFERLLEEIDRKLMEILP